MSGVVDSPISSSGTHPSQTESPHSTWTLIEPSRPTSVSSLIHHSSPFIGPIREQISLPTLPPIAHVLTHQSSPQSYVTGDQGHNDATLAPAFADRHPSISSIDIPQLPSIYLEKPIWPLKDPTEALLLRHYVQNLAIWVSDLSSDN
jgi:hypothetical protein